jgi:hypothetical protein
MRDKYSKVSNGEQSEKIAARQSLVCSDPESFFQAQNKPTKKPS